MTENTNNTVLIRKTPFLFVRLLVLAEFIFAFLPVFVTTIFPVQAEYNQTALAQSLSFTALFAIVMITLQILVITISVFAWYLPIYQIDRRRVLYKRIGALDFKELIKIPAISCISPEQGWLGRRFNYGDVQLYSNTEVGMVSMRNIPDPTSVAIKLEELVADYWETPPPPEIQPIPELLTAGESDFVEFKASILWDYRQNKPNKSLSESIIKSVTAFMNSAGGTLLIGVDDDGNILGLGPDFAVMEKPDPDGFELVFNQAFNRMIGTEFRSLVYLSFSEIEGKIICIVAIQPAAHPVYFQQPDQEEFYIRVGNASQPLPVSKAAEYIHERFQL